MPLVWSAATWNLDVSVQPTIGSLSGVLEVYPTVSETTLASASTGTSSSTESRIVSLAPCGGTVLTGKARMVLITD